MNLTLLAAAYGLPPPAVEYRFWPGRRYAFDLAWPAYQVALEQEGGLFGRGKPCPLCRRRGVGAHTSVQRLKSDLEKYSEAAIRGWCVIRATPDQIAAAEAWDMVERALLSRGWRRGVR